MIQLKKPRKKNISIAPTFYPPLVCGRAINRLSVDPQILPFFGVVIFGANVWILDISSGQNTP